MRASTIKEGTLYRDIVRGAFEIAWRRRELLPLGFLASLLMMNGGAFEFIIRAIYKISSGDPYAGGAANALAVFNALMAGDAAGRMSVFFSLLVFLAVFALVVLVAASASGALLQTIARRAKTKTRSMGRAFASGAAHVGQLVLTQLVGRTVIFAAFVLAALGVYSSIDGRFGIAVGVILFVIFALVALIISFLMMMTNAGIMIGNERWVNAAHDAFRFLKRHWLVSLEMIGLVFLATIASTALILAALAVVIAPFTLILLALSALHATAIIAVTTFIFGALGLFIVLIGGSMLAVFEHAAWALLYTRLVDRSAISKLERLWEKLKNMRKHARPRRR